MSNSELPEYVERLEQIDGEIAAMRSDRKDLMEEAASRGFDKKALARLLRERTRRAKNPKKFQAENDAFDVYASAMKLFE